MRGHFDRSDAQHRRAEKSGFRYRPEKAATVLRTGKEIRFRFWLSEDKAGKEAKRRTTGW